MKIKILYLSFFSEVGGGETALLHLATQLKKHNIKPVVMVPKKGKFSELLTDAEIETKYIALSGYLVRTFFVPGFSVFDFWRLYQVCIKEKPQLIHINNLNLVLYAGIVGKILKIPVFATAHGIWDSYYFFHELLHQIFISKIIAITDHVAKFLSRFQILQQKKIKTIYLGIDTAYFKPGNKRHARNGLDLPDRLTVTIASRLDPSKDHATFLQAMKLVLQKIPSVTVYILGDAAGDFSNTNNALSYADRIRRLVNDNPKLYKNTIWGGFKKDMAPAYQATDVLVSTSLLESFPLILLEAAACALPIVTTHTNSQNLIVKNNVNGFLIPKQNPNILAEKIMLLLKNARLRKTFGENGRRHILKNYSLNKSVDSVVHEYKTFLIKR